MEISNTRSNMERINFLLDLAEAYIEEEDYTSAVNAYERILRIDPQEAKALYILSYVYISDKQYEKAKDLFFKLLKENPDDYQILNNLAWLYATAEDPAYRNGKKAVRYAREALAIAPNDYHVWSTLAEAHYVSGNYKKAYTAAKQMAEMATRYARNLTEKEVDSYNEQLRKCKRALDAAKFLEGNEDSKTESLEISIKKK
jgi:tetratricopeptide (TPR) repeat protein